MKYPLLQLLIILFLSSPLLYNQTISEDYNRGMDYYNKLLYTDAHKVFEKIVKEYGIEDELYASARFYSANSLLKMGKEEEAASEFEFIVNNIGWSKFREESLFTLGLIYFDLQRYSLCRKNLLILIYQHPDNEHRGNAMYLIGESYAAEGKLSEAIEFLMQSIEDKSDNNYSDYTLYALASVYEKTKDYKNAVRYYDDLLTYHPSSPLVFQAQVRIGICYFHLKDYYNSILELSNPRVGELQNENLAEALYILANSHYRVEEYEDAVEIYIEIIERFPNSKLTRDAQYGLGWAYFQQSKYDDAYNIFNSLSQGTDSLAIQSFIWKGEAKRYSGNNKDALKIFQDFLEQYPSDPSAPAVESLIGLIYFEQKNYQLSAQYLSNSTSSNDPVTRAKAFTMLGEIELNKKNYVKARGKFEPAIRITEAENSVHLRALLGLGVSLFFLGEYEEAAEYIREAETINSTFETDKINFYMAESYYKAKKYQEALSRYNAIASTDDQYVKQAIYSRGYCHFNLGSYSNSASQFSEFIERYPNDPRVTDARLRLADSYFGSKNFSAASKIFSQLFKSGNYSSDDPYAYYQYAQALYKSGETEAAINEFRNLQQKFPGSAYAENSLFTIGFIRFQNNEYKEAISDYRNVLEVYKNTTLAPAVYYSMGDSHFNMEMYDSAIANYRTVLTKYPSSEYVFDAVNGMQYSYVAMGKQEEAINLIDRYISQNPNMKFSDVIYFKKGEIYYSQRDYQNAKTSYQEFIAKYPKSTFVPEAYYWLGKSSQNLKQDEEAIFYFNKVFENYPGSQSAAVSVIELGKIYELLGNYQESIQLLENASKKLKDSPRIPEILFIKGNAYIRADDIQKAYATFEELATYHRDDLFADKAKFEMGLIDLAAARYDLANKYFLEIAENRIDELGASAQYHYGLSLYEQDRFTEAISALVRIRTVYSIYDEWLSRSYLLMGDCYVELDDKRKAEEMYRVVVSRNKGDQLGEEARQKINKLK